MNVALNNRRLLAAALVGALALCALALAGPGDAASAVKPGTIAVRTKTPLSQQGLLQSGTVRTHVGLGIAGRLRVTAGVVSQGRSSAKPISKPVVIRFRQLGTKKATLSLSPSGRTLLADCAAQSLVVSARQLGLDRPSGGPVAKVTAEITIDNPACAG